jgi:hypothetical protein
MVKEDINGSNPPVTTSAAASRLLREEIQSLQGELPPNTKELWDSLRLNIVLDTHTKEYVNQAEVDNRLDILRNKYLNKT